MDVNGFYRFIHGHVAYASAVTYRWALVRECAALERIIVFVVEYADAQESSFTITSDCACPGQTILLECTVSASSENAGGSTVWKELVQFNIPLPSPSPVSATVVLGWSSGMLWNLK